MDSKKATSLLEAAVETFNCLGEARRKLTGVELTSELFDEINGAERGLENLLGKPITIDFSSASEIAQLKQEIFAAIESEEVECGKQIHAALEYFCEDLTRIMQDYNAYSEENVELRNKLEQKLKALTKDGVDHLNKMRLDFECFAYAHALEIPELMNDLTKFFGSETCNLHKLAAISIKNGPDMTEEESEFLDLLKKVFSDDVRNKGWDKLDVLWGDRLTNAKFETLGYTTKNLVEVAKALTKAENTFYKTTRKIRETLCHETSTTEELATKNTKYWKTMNCLIWYARDVSAVAKALAEQLALMSKIIDVAANPPEPEPKNTDDPYNKDGDDNTDVNNPPQPEA